MGESRHMEKLDRIPGLPRNREGRLLHIRHPASSLANKPPQHSASRRRSEARFVERHARLHVSRPVRNRLRSSEHRKGVDREGPQRASLAHRPPRLPSRRPGGGGMAQARPFSSAAGGRIGRRGKRVPRGRMARTGRRPETQRTAHGKRLRDGAQQRDRRLQEPPGARGAGIHCVPERRYDRAALSHVLPRDPSRRLTRQNSVLA